MPKRIDVMQVAAETLRDLDIDQTRPVDPFKAIAALDLEVLFLPLDKLLGAVLPAQSEGTRAGVLVTTERQASIQRYTAAHEIGHWMMDQDQLSVDIPLDTSEEVMGTPRSERERNAQLFASHFLMPLPLVSRVARQHGVKRRSQATPLQAYSIARDMHVSYEAAVRQLTNCHFIAPANASELLRVPPMKSKRAIGGRKPTESRGDVWSATPSDEQISIEVFAGDDIVVDLGENRSTGYFWELKDEKSDATYAMRPGGPSGPEGTPLPVVSDEFTPLTVADDRDDLIIGAPGRRRLVLHAEEPGAWPQVLRYASPFRPQAPAADAVLVDVTVRENPEGETKTRRLEMFAREMQEDGDE